MTRDDFFFITTLFLVYFGFFVSYCFVIADSDTFLPRHVSIVVCLTVEDYPWTQNHVELCQVSGAYDSHAHRFDDLFLSRWSTL